MFNPFSALTSKIFAGASLALLLALGVQTLRANHYHTDRDRWHSAFDAQKAAYVAAQEAATAKAIAAKIQTEARYAKIARQAAAEREESTRLRSAAAEYARTHRVRFTPAIGGAAGRPAPASGDNAPGGGDGPLGPSDWIAVSPADYGRYNAIVERMQRVKAWGDRLITEGLAIPDPAFGGG